jgi:hypothetical protein
MARVAEHSMCGDHLTRVLDQICNQRESPAVIRSDNGPERQVTIFPAASLRALILLRLPPTSFVGHVRFQWNAIRRGNLPQWMVIAALCAMAVGALLAKAELRMSVKVASESGEAGRAGNDGVDEHGVL